MIFQLAVSLARCLHPLQMTQWYTYTVISLPMPYRLNPSGPAGIGNSFFVCFSSLSFFLSFASSSYQSPSFHYFAVVAHNNVSAWYIPLCALPTHPRGTSTAAFKRPLVELWSPSTVFPGFWKYPKATPRTGMAALLRVLGS